MKILISGLFCLLTLMVFAQAPIKKLNDNFINNLKKSGINTIIEVRINNENPENFKTIPKTYFYYKNKPEFNYKFCCQKIDKKTISHSECNDNWQSAFDLISDNLDEIKRERIIPDTSNLPGGKVRLSSPSKFDIIEIVWHNGKEKESIKIRKDYFLPIENSQYKKNILTKTFLLWTLLEGYNNEIEKNNNR